MRERGPALAGPALAFAGAVVLAAAVLSDAPLGRFLGERVLTPTSLMPLAGLGLAFALSRGRVVLLAVLLYAVGITLGFLFYRPLLDPLWAIPSASEHAFLTGPAMNIVVGIVLILGTRSLGWLLVPAAFAAGLLLALRIVAVDWSVTGYGNRIAGVAVALWLIASVALTIRAFARNWFNIAARILGSWLIAIGLLYGAAVFVPPPQ